MLYELSSLFSPDGNGLAFLANVVYKYGRPYTVADEVMKSFMVLVDALEDLLVEVQPARLLASADLYIQLLHFLALIKILEPNKWYTNNNNSPSNRSDYSHPIGINLTSAHKQTGAHLVDHMMELLLRRDPAGAPNPLLASCSVAQLIDLLGGFAALMPDGRPNGAITRAILEVLEANWSRQNSVVQSVEEMERIERLYFTLSASDVRHDGLLASLLDEACDGAAAAKEELAPGSHPPLRLSDALRAAAAARRRGPFFFSAVARDARAAVKRCAVAMWESSFAAAKAAGSRALVQALAESGMELLLACPDREQAARTALRVGLHGEALQGIPFCEVLAERVVEEAQGRDPIQLSRLLKDTQPQLAHARPRTEESYVRLFKGQRVHPIRTFLASLEYVNDMDHLFLLHSSILDRGVHELISVLRRLRTGKDTLLLTTAGLKAIQAKAAYGASAKQRKACERALEMLSFEMEQGRVVLLTCVDEILLHDAGVYCDEDLLMWSVAAYLAREMPLVKVHALVSPSSPAARPHHLLKGPHSTMRRSSDLYNKDMPLLSALRSRELRAATHLVSMRGRVRDRPNVCTMSTPRGRTSSTGATRRCLTSITLQRAIWRRASVAGHSRRTRVAWVFTTPEHPQVPYTPHPLVVKYLKK
ncbi:hypothetical protein STCU_07387 [Strigomonas culicis]|uniref:Uncharacterized protein n=1 Tax=Strigomonas culicis TaxID=28005 RepID=S9U4S1_9TRYP|nr:hypothetical protein STCU_07387 [Strigomonas culicis]|eukprot:EPY23938.1 hypothetical protein STCU_07387 [Strigomonas culicis]